MTEQTRTGKGGTRKIGRNKSKCALYKAQGKREKNKAKKARKIAKFLKRKEARRLKHAKKKPQPDRSVD